MTKIELYHLTEALEGARDELVEMMEREDWFVSDRLDQIDIALEILSNVVVEK